MLGQDKEFNSPSEYETFQLDTSLDISLILQVIVASHCDEVREVIQRLGHLKEGGSALAPGKAGACPLLDTLDVLLKIVHSNSNYFKLV